MFAKHPEALLIPHLRGELEGAARARMEEHLRGCAQCRAQRDQLSAGLDAIRQQVAELLAPDWTAYRTELRRKLAAREENRARSWWRPATLVWASIAAAGVTAVLVLSAVSLHRGPNVEQLELGDADVGLLRNYSMVEKIELLENYEVIEHLDELSPAADTRDARHL
jgi:anti-sigma factor RsiW